MSDEGNGVRKCDLCGVLLGEHVAYELREALRRDGVEHLCGNCKDDANDAYQGMANYANGLARNAFRRWVANRLSSFRVGGPK